MQRTLLAALALTVSVAAASAQPSPPTGPGASPPPPPPAAPPAGLPAPGSQNQDMGMAMRHAHGMLGPSIRMKGPGGAEVSMRCAAGESSRTCAEVVGQLLERAMASRADRRRDDDDDGPRRDRYRDRY